MMKVQLPLMMLIFISEVVRFLVLPVLQAVDRRSFARRSRDFVPLKRVR